MIQAGFPVENTGMPDALAETANITQYAEVEHTQALLAAIVESTPDAIHSLAPDGTIVSWNHGSEVLLGYTSAEAIGQNFAFLIPQNGIEDAKRAIDTLLHGGAIPPVETDLLAKGGRTIEVTLTLAAIRNRAGNMVGTSAIAHDIRQRRKAEQVLRASREFAQSTIDALDEGAQRRHHQLHAG